jgi:hypothetical protein
MATTNPIVTLRCIFFAGQPDGATKDVFVHILPVERAGLSTLTEGAKITFDIADGKEAPWLWPSRYRDADIIGSDPVGGAGPLIRSIEFSNICNSCVMLNAGDSKVWDPFGERSQ